MASSMVDRQKTQPSSLMAARSVVSPVTKACRYRVKKYATELAAPCWVFSVASVGLTGLGAARAVARWACSSGLSEAGALVVGAAVVVVRWVGGVPPVSGGVGVLAQAANSPDARAPQQTMIRTRTTGRGQ
ncbi:hypothetical protein B6G06_05505 [Actinomyces gaoshouyii]|nr:hypothetical protein B6G06_05505 [Actinomyces gaoshouyii]